MGRLQPRIWWRNALLRGRGIASITSVLARCLPRVNVKRILQVLMIGYFMFGLFLSAFYAYLLL